jgi:hypothetical protein
VKTFPYTPKLEGWSGTLSLKVPGFSERLTLAKELNISGLQDAPQDEQLDMLMALYKKVQTHIEAVNLKCGDFEVKDLDTLECVSDFIPIVVEIVQVLANGISVGKN